MRHAKHVTRAASPRLRRDPRVISQYALLPLGHGVNKRHVVVKRRIDRSIKQLSLAVTGSALRGGEYPPPGRPTGRTRIPCAPLSRGQVRGQVAHCEATCLTPASLVGENRSCAITAYLSSQHGSPKEPLSSVHQLIWAKAQFTRDSDIML